MDRLDIILLMKTVKKKIYIGGVRFAGFARATAQGTGESKGFAPDCLQIQRQVRGVAVFKDSVLSLSGLTGTSQPENEVVSIMQILQNLAASEGRVCSVS